MKVRFFCLALLLFSLFSLLVFQFYRLQLIEHEKWQKIGDNQHYFVVQEPFTRGTFYARGGEKLVFDLLKYHLFVDPKSIPDKDKRGVIEGLIPFLGEEKRKKITENFHKKSRSRKLTAWLSMEQKRAIEAWWLPYAKAKKLPKNGLYFVSDYKRSYPFGALLGQVMHTVQDKKDEITKKSFPTGGLELYYQSILDGKMGGRRFFRSPINQFEIGEVLEEPIHGADIHLTIDLNLQAICEDEIKKGVEAAQAKRGWAVMLEPETGKILALAQYPPFDPTHYADYFKEPSKIEDTRVKAIQDAQEPGSSFKPLTLLLAFLANQELAARGEPPCFSPDEKIACKDGTFPGRKKAITDTHVHAFLNMEMALQKSSNIYMGRLMQRIIDRLGDDWVRNQYTQVFGFSSKTGIELPAESCGLVPRQHILHPNGTLEWSLATPFSISFGHNILVTGVQLLRAYAMIANGGYFVRPTLIEKIQRDHHLLTDHTSIRKQDFPRHLDETITTPVKRALKFSTKYGGTARKADVPGYTEAGKTSTAKKVIGGRYSEKQYIPSMVGFAPFDQPAFVLLVTIDEPKYGFIPEVGLNHHGGAACAPVFSKISYRSLKYLGIPEDDPFGYPYSDPRRDRKKADWMEEIDALKELYDTWNVYPNK